MRIINNLQAMNATRQLNVNTNQAAKSMEKLSSGYRINRAGDDAAGLAITEKMRAQIRGLNQASKNSQEGISLIQTAEAALNETHSVLQRMRELAVQAATGTLQDEDRGQIDKEFKELMAEVNDIAEQTQFNKMNLLDGTFGTKIASDSQLKAEESGPITAINLSGAKSGTVYTLTNGASGELTLSAGGVSQTITGLGDTYSGTVNFDILGISLTLEGADLDADSGLGGGIKTDSNAQVNIQTGANEGETLTLSIEDMTANGLGISDANTLTAENAANAITLIEDAIKLVSDERAKLGATQNRLEYKIKNLNSSAENLQSAESGIRDVDMATEMVNYTKNEILQQAAQAMLSKANLAPQSILQLLR
ncbi:MAG: flagellin [Eubacteriales bacterium]|nr:flagellin [Eubacteriales bacterium]